MPAHIAARVAVGDKPRSYKSNDVEGISILFANRLEEALQFPKLLAVNLDTAGRPAPEPGPPV